MTANSTLRLGLKIVAPNCAVCLYELRPSHRIEEYNDKARSGISPAARQFVPAGADAVPR